MRRSIWLGVLGVLTLTWSVLSARAATCPGDCSNTMQVHVNDLITCVSIALGSQQPSVCLACDPDNSGTVTINEIIAAVNAALIGCNPAPTLTPGGPTPSPTTGSPTPTATTSSPICGNGVPEADEDCDPPHPGQGCAANCTTETRRTAVLDPATSLSPIQTIGQVLDTIHVSGTQVLTTGRARDAAVMGPGNKQLFAPGEAPIVVKAADVKFDPVNVLGLSCACIRAVPVPAFGEGISGVGVAGCGMQGLSNIDFLVEEDHDTTPGSPGNSGSGAGLDDDDSCSKQFTATVDGTLAAAGSQIKSDACLEGVDANCSAIVGTQSQYTKHFAIPSCVGGLMPGMTCKTNADCPGSTCVGGPNPGMACTTMDDCGGGTCTAAVCKSAGMTRPAACNSPRVYTFSGKQAKTGSVLLINNTSQTLLPNVGGTSTCVGGPTPGTVCKSNADCGGGACQPDACIATQKVDGTCSASTFGKDCLPCTPDDTLIVDPMVVPTTSGTASVRIYDVGDNTGVAKGTVLGLPGQMCGMKPCITSVTGELADCEALKHDPNAPLSGSLVTASPNLDSQVGDVALTTRLAAKPPSGDTTP